MKVSAQFFLGDSMVAELKDKVIQQQIYVVNEAPVFEAGAPIVGSHRSLRVSFQSKSTVKVEPAGDKAPSKVNVYVVDLNDLTTASLPAKKFNGTAGADTEGLTCAFNAPAGGSGACVTCDPSVYLDDSAIAAQFGDDIKIVDANVSDGAATVSNLDNDRRYAVFLQYEPDGLLVSECLPGQPSPNFTLTELNGEGDAKVVDFRCFIATAAYGTPDHDDVAAFRDFRDSILMTSAAGRAAVELYYRLSPPLASLLDEHPEAKPFVRAVLGVPAAAWRWFKS